MTLSIADYAVLAGYLVGVTALGLWVAKREKPTITDYFRAGDKLPWFAIGFSLVATRVRRWSKLSIESQAFGDAR